MTSPWFVTVLFVAVVVWELAVLVLKAGRQRFWYDELFTLHVSSLQPFSRLRRALQEGVDAIPLGYYLLVRLARIFPGDPHLTLRLPSILGYILSLLGVYWFALKGLPAPAALTAVILISLSPFRKYSLEARPYSLLVGFLAMSAVVWLRIDEKWFMMPLFAIFLTLAVSSHYLSVLVISFFSIAELTRSLLFHRIHWGVWAACLLATGPFFVGLPHLLRFRSIFGKHFFARPPWSMVFETYSDYLGIDYKLSLVLIVFFGIVVGERGASLPEIILVGGFVLYPALLVVLTKLLHSGYTPRYGWPGVLGLALGSAYLFSAIWLKPFSAYLLGAFLIAFAVQGVQDFRLLPKPGSAKVDQRWIKLAELSRDQPGIPVVIGSGLACLEAVQYSPPELRDRLLKVIDPDIATRLTGWDTADEAIRILAQFVPLRVEDLASFQALHQRFIMYSGGAGDWLTEYLVERRYHLKLLSRDAGWSVYIASQEIDPEQRPREVCLTKADGTATVSSFGTRTGTPSQCTPEGRATGIDVVLSSPRLHQTADASLASLLVCITFHYVPARLFYLLDVVRALADFPVRRLDLVVLTNTVDPTERASISVCLGPELYDGKTLEVLSYPGLPHPHDLAWSHKQLIRERVLPEGSLYTHFVYLEDDIRFTYVNFCYFTAFRPKLAAKGLVPSFVRAECNLADGQLYATDYLARFNPDTSPSTIAGDYRFCGVAYPYCGLFVLDRELTKEYVASPSFRQDSSASVSVSVSEWGPRERAAMGLCWERPPLGFRTRYVIPVELNTGLVSNSCWVAHLPNNYANEPSSPYGKIPMNQLTSIGNDTMMTPHTPEPNQFDLADLRRNLHDCNALQNSVGSLNPRNPGLQNNLIQLVKRVMQRALSWYTRPLHEFHSAVTQTLNETTKSLENAQAGIQQLRAELIVSARLDSRLGLIRPATMKDDAVILSLPLPSYVPRRYRPGNLGNWSAHLAFAHDLMGATQPKLIVELGTHWGESYFGFCQGVTEHGLDCLCYAVDHWLGDAHAERYGEEVYEDVRQYNDTHYRAFSYLLRTSFDDALVQFRDGTIDLLHIDGLHTYEASSHDFRTWLPKVRPGGIVLLHDIAVRHADFGIWLLWDEIKAEFPETFEFHHSWGLGVLRKPGGEGQQHALLEALFNSPPSIQEQIRRLYVIYTSHLENILAPADEALAEAQRSAAQEDRARASAELDRVALEDNALRRRLEKLDRTHARTLEELASVRRSLELEQRIRRSMETSRSWRITKPMRGFMLALRGKPRTDEFE